MKFLDLFAGIGGFRLGMEMAGHECVGHIEKDKFARMSYSAIHGTDYRKDWEWHDIKKLSNKSIRKLRRRRGKVDVICGGFPCQAFSIAGKRGGFADTRGTLFFEIARIASILKPRYLFLENVTGLLNHDNGNTFETILRTLDEVGYDAEWDCINSKDHEVPQNRERVFIIGHLRGECTRKVFPIRGTYTTISISKAGNIRKNKTSQSGNVFHTNGLSPTLCSEELIREPLKIVEPVLTPDRLKKGQNGRRFKGPDEPMFTLTAQDRHGVAIVQKARGFNEGGIHQIAPTLTENSWEQNNHLLDGIRIRKLTPKECWRLQGFPDWAFEKADAVNSDSQLYKQAGNSVTVNVIYEIAKRL